MQADITPGHVTSRFRPDERSAKADTTYELPAASVVVIRGNIRGQ